MVVMPIAAAGLRLMPRSSRNTHSAGLDGEQLAGDLVEARLGFAHTDLARLDDLIEPSHHVGDVRAGIAADDVVRETGRRVAGGLDRDRVRRPSPGAPRPTAARARRRRRCDVRAPPTRLANRVSKSAGPMSLRSRWAHALSSGSVALTDRMNPRREAVLVLVTCERFERAGEDDAAEIPENCSDHDRRAYDGSPADPSRCRLDVANLLVVAEPCWHQQRGRSNDQERETE